jgi:hypothetical protein
MLRAGSKWFTIVNLKDALLVHPGGAVSASATFKYKDIWLCSTSRFPLGNMRIFLQTHTGLQSATEIVT